MISLAQSLDWLFARWLLKAWESGGSVCQSVSLAGAGNRRRLRCYPSLEDVVCRSPHGCPGQRCWPGLKTPLRQVLPAVEGLAAETGKPPGIAPTSALAGHTAACPPCLELLHPFCYRRLGPVLLLWRADDPFAAANGTHQACIVCSARSPAGGTGHIGESDGDLSSTHTDLAGGQGG